MAKQTNMTLSDFNANANELKNTFTLLINGNPYLSDLCSIFNVAINDLSLFPNIRLNENATYKDYLIKWIKGYTDSFNNLPSKRIASPKGSCSDPAIKTIVQIAAGIDDITAKKCNNYHNLFMSAENIQGNLLEEYISICVKPFGWVWCNGNVLRAVDFCTIDGSALLQIKNKSNTENSSSSAIRSGTDIKKWYRLGTQTRNGTKVPSYKWDSLNEIINTYAPENTSNNNICNMNENSYQEFLRNVASRNIRIITEK